MTRKRNAMALRRYSRRARPLIARAVAEQQRAEDRAAKIRALALLKALRGVQLRVPLWNLNRNRQ